MPPRKAEAGAAEAAARKRKRNASVPIRAAAGGDAAAGGSASGSAGGAPPPTIVFSTGAPAPAPANWCGAVDVRANTADLFAWCTAHAARICSHATASRFFTCA